MNIIGLVGLPGSGKSEAATVAEELGIPVITMGDVIRNACKERGLDPARHHGTVAEELREEGGPGAIAEESIPVIEDALIENETVVVDGIRSDAEVTRFKEAFGDDFLLVCIEAPFELREQRITSRGRDDTSADGESLSERDERELGFGMGEAMEIADIYLRNTDSLEVFRQRIREFLP